MRNSFPWILCTVLLATSVPAVAQLRISVTVAPPPLPVYEQPLCPDDGYIWTPGYWSWDDFAGGYYWVPGTWVLPPEVGLLWTPGYWTWRSSAFVFVAGYWGPVVGFYGGIDYGFGYPGHGYYGGRWVNGHFSYNRAVNHVNGTVIHNTYTENVQVQRSPKRVSYNGGQGGIVAHPTTRETEAANERHVRETQAQVQHVQHARSLPELHAKANHGAPPLLATSRPQSPTQTSQSRSPHAGGGGATNNQRASRQDVQPRTQPTRQRPPQEQPRQQPQQERARPPQAQNESRSRPDRSQLHKTKRNRNDSKQR